MEKTKTHSAEGGGFFDILSDADTIKVRELPPENPEQNVEALAQAWDDMGKSALPQGGRLFLVQVGPRPAPKEVTPDSPENHQQLLSSANLLLVEGDVVLARNIFSFLLKSNIQDTEALRGLGICLLRLSQPTLARRCFRALLELTKSAEAHYWLGETYAADGDDKLALEHYIAVNKPEVMANEIRFGWLKALGNCHTRLGNLEEAWKAYHRAIELQPSSDAIYVNLGTLEIQRSHLDVARSYFDKALEINPQCSRAKCGLGLIEIAKRNVKGAELTFQQALDLDSQNLLALKELVSICREPKSMAATEERLRKYLEKDHKNLEVRTLLCILLFRMGEWTRCNREVSELLAQDPKNIQAQELRNDLHHNKHLTTKF